MIGPLIHDSQLQMFLIQLTDAVFAQQDKTFAGDQIRNSMIDFRIDVIRTSGKYDSLKMMLMHIIQGSLAFFTNIALENIQFFISRFKGMLQLMIRNIKFLELFLQYLKHRFRIIKRNKWIFK